jgi:hypothetical protein
MHTNTHLSCPQIHKHALVRATAASRHLHPHHQNARHWCTDATVTPFTSAHSRSASASRRHLHPRGPVTKMQLTDALHDATLRSSQQTVASNHSHAHHQAAAHCKHDALTHIHLTFHVLKSTSTHCVVSALMRVNIITSCHTRT